MNQGTKGTEIFWAGWMIAVVTFYLGGLDTGLWLPVAVTAVEIVALLLMLTGIRQFIEKHRNFNTAAVVAAIALIISLGTEGILILSTGEVSEWMGIAAIFLAVAGDILFVVLTGLVLLGHCALIRMEGNENVSNRLGYLWVLFITFSVLYMLIQVVAVLLVNENLEALTYVVPAAGLPILVAGVLIIVNLYRSHSPITTPQTQQENQ